MVILSSKSECKGTKTYRFCIAFYAIFNKPLFYGNSNIIVRLSVLALFFSIFIKTIANTPEAPNSL